MSINADKKRLSQTHTLAEIQRELKSNKMVTVYQVDKDAEEHSKRYIFCALIPSSQIQDALADSTWDLEFSDGMPSGLTYHKQGELQREYLRYGVDNGVEPLIINRNFYRLREEYSEISEEFRLFHQLYHDRKTDQFLKIDDVGNEEVVATVKPDHIQIRLKEIRQFLAIKEMHLAIQFIFSETSLHPLEELELQAGDENFQDGLMCWLHRYGDHYGIGNCQTFSYLVGKRLLEPLPKTKSGFWPFATEQQHWRQHNIPPTGGISKTYFDRQLGAQFTNSDMPEHVFEQRYRDLQKVSQEELGENWLLPLSTADAYHLQHIRIPATDEQRDFDELVLSLTKILIDSLNEAYLKKMIPFEKRQEYKEKRGMALLEAALHLNKIKGTNEHVDFLKKLQSLRSSGSAHRKGGKYEKIAKHFGIENKSLSDVFIEILNSATKVLDFFITLVKSGQIREIVENNQLEAGYAAMGEMIGIANSGSTDGSVNHDNFIFKEQSKT